MPIFLIAFNFFKNFSHSRIKQLLYFETFFNFSMVIGSFGIIYNEYYLVFLSKIFITIFFVIQFSGFIYQSKSKKSLQSYLQTILGFSVLLIWFYQHFPLNHTYSNGTFLLFGTPVFQTFKIIYSLWALNLIFIDSIYLPNLTQAILQLSSLSLALYHEDFFHVRLTTAAHLFLLDGVFKLFATDSRYASLFSINKEYWYKFSKKHTRTVKLTITTLITFCFIWEVTIQLN